MFKKSLNGLIFVILTLLAASCSLSAPATSSNGHSDANKSQMITGNFTQMRTGAVKPTAEQQRYFESNEMTIISIKPNRLFIDRLSAQKGLQMARTITPASSGDELTTIPFLEYQKKVKSGGISTKALLPAALPLAIDNSTLNAFPPIDTQGGLGSCACFSSTYYQFSHEIAFKFGINNKGGLGSTGNVIFSPKWTYNMVNGGYDYGSWMESAYSVMMSIGCARWDLFPYVGDGSNPENYRAWCLVNSTRLDALKYRVTQYGSMSIDPSLDALKAYLANGHVVTFATYIFSWVFMPISNNPNSTLDDSLVGQSACYYVTNTYSGAHSMTIVGYNDEVWVDINHDGVVQDWEKGVLIVANSWGTWAGNFGYYYICYDALRSSPYSGITTGRDSAFWGSCVYYIDVDQFTPRYISQFTLNNGLRNDICIYSGTGTNGNFLLNLSPFYVSGGPFSFAGNSTACDGTFYFDMTPRMQGGSNQVYLQVQDINSGSPTIIRDFSVTDTVNQVAFHSPDTPVTIDPSLPESLKLMVINTSSQSSSSTSSASSVSSSSSYNCQTVALIAKANDKYVSVALGGSLNLIASASTAGTNEKFLIRYNNDGTVFLKAVVNNMYVSADNAGSNNLIANRDSANLWEKFTIISNSDGTISFRAAVNNLYVTAENGGALPLIANRATISTWEKFTAVKLDNNPALLTYRKQGTGSLTSNYFFYNSISNLFDSVLTGGIVESWGLNDAETTSTTPPLWVYVDLGRNYVISESKVYYENVGTRAQNYQMDYLADGENTNSSTWSNAVIVSGNVYQFTDNVFSCFVARYVRLYIANPFTSTPNPLWGLKFCEFEVYGY